MGLLPWLRQTVKTVFTVRCKILDRQDHSIAFWSWPVKRRRALRERNRPRNSRLELIDADERREWACDAAPGFLFLHRIDRFPMPRKTHATSCRAAASTFRAASWASNSAAGM